jgi:zinc protease
MDLANSFTPLKKGSLFVVLGLIFLSACSKFEKNLWLPQINAHREVLPNGLTVLYLEDPASPVVSYSSWFKVGSVWERPGKTGLAHLFEHLMFKGTPNNPEQQFFKKLESKGAMVNAYTERGQTVFYEVFAPQHLKLVIELESDRLANLAVSERDLELERKVVMQERKLRVDSQFAAQQAEALMQAAFPDSSPGWPVIGYAKDLERISVRDANEFFKSHYAPNFALVVVAGAFDRKQASKWIRESYSKIPPATARKDPLIKPLKLTEDRVVTVRRPVKNTSVMLAYPIPSIFHEDANRLSMLAWALFDMESSVGNQELVRDRKVALSVGADAMLEPYPFLFMISLDLVQGKTSAEGIEALDAVLDSVARSGFHREQIDRVKNRLLYSIVNQGKTPIGMASWIASGELFWGDYKRIYTLIDSFRSMQPDDLESVLQRYLVGKKRIISILEPEVSRGGQK